MTVAMPRQRFPRRGGAGLSLISPLFLESAPGLVPEFAPEFVPEFVPEFAPEFVPEFVPEFAPESGLESALEPAQAKFSIETAS